MAIDELLLERHRGYRDEDLGIAEQFVRISMPAGTMLGVLSMPSGGGGSLGWVICHSFGMEQVDLQSLEATLARRLAAAGYPVLRFQCLGYGDSDPGDVPPSAITQVRDTEAAVAELSRLSGVTEVALVGARFGGTVAALVADEVGAADLALIAPIVSGSRLMNEMLRSVVMREMVKMKSDRVPSMKELVDEMKQKGLVDVRGFALTKEVYEANNAVDLMKDLKRFSGRSLVAQVSRSETPQGGLTRLAEHLRGLGGNVTQIVVTDSWAPAVGQPRFSAQPGGIMIDVLETLYQEVADRVLTWMGSGKASGEDQP